MGWIIGAGAFLAGIVLAGIVFVLVINHRKKIGADEIEAAKSEAKRIVDEAQKTGETRKKELSSKPRKK